MESESLGFVSRLVLMLTLPFRLIFDGRAARLVERALAGDVGQALPPAATERVVEKIVEKVVERPVEREAPKVDVAAIEAAGGLHVLAILQREARLVDFFMEDIASYSDAEVGAAVRVVHEGGRKFLKEYVVLAPVRSEAEESVVVVEKGFDPDTVRLTGQVTGEPPFKGRLAHKGWAVRESKLPVRQATGAVKVLQPAEIEIA